MGVLTLLRFLIGDREAILAVARDRNALWLGLVFVLSAGFAREYDGEDLLFEPWHLLLPLGASLVASFLMYAVVVQLRWLLIGPWPEEKRAPVGFWGGYLSFLGLFWMMAPLAWLYAVPYEQFLAPEGAIYANLCTLAVVAAWRVVLMVRIVTVCSELGLSAALFRVLVVVLGLVVVALFFYFNYNFSLIVVMGGLREADRAESFRARVLFNSGVWLTLAAAVLLGVTGIVGIYGYKGEAWLTRHDETKGWPTGEMIGLAVLSLLVWVPILPLTQPEQQRRRAFERAIHGGDYKAVAALLNRPREAFPPDWEPPVLSDRGLPPVSDLVFGRIAMPGSGEQCVKTLVALDEQGGPEWAIELYERRLLQIVEEGLEGWASNEMEAVVDALPRFPLGVTLLEEARKEPPKGKEDAMTRRASTVRWWIHETEKARRAADGDGEK
jgi:hypothetical protein